MNGGGESDESETNFFHWIDSMEKDNSVKSLKIISLKDEDLISELPDSIVVHILSFLPTLEEVIRTSILSKRWKYLWTSIPVLDFSNYKSRPLSEFASFIDKTLDQCRHSKLKKLGVDFEVDYEQGFTPQLNRCIRYAVDCNVEELDISFLCDHELLFELPNYVFANDYFTRLELYNCMFVPNGLISWKALKALTIGFSELSEDLIRNVMSGCPVLEILNLNFCYGFNRLNITSPSVKKLVLCGYFESYKSEEDAVLEIYAPNILSLELNEDLSLWKLLLVSVPSLIKATIDFSRYMDNLDVIDEDADENMLKDILRSLAHVSELEIGEW